jgi:hypothetical protein
MKGDERELQLQYNPAISCALFLSLSFAFGLLSTVRQTVKSKLLLFLAFIRFYFLAFIRFFFLLIFK